MKNILFLFTAFVICSSLNGCKDNNNDKHGGMMKSPNYVQTYINASDFDLKEVEGVEQYILSILFKGESISSMYPANQKSFEVLAESFNDVSYSGYVIPNANKVISESLTKVNIVSSKDFDENHKAGQSLNDIVLLCATSPYEFIQGGYKDFTKDDEYPEYWYGMVMNRDVGYKPVEMTLNAVTLDNSKMLYPICYLYFTETPKNNGEHIFTITVKIGDKEVSKNIKHLF